MKDTFTQVRSRIRHSKAKVLQLMVASTPEGTDNVLYREYFEKQVANRRVYRGVTYDNPYLPSEYIETLKASYSPELAAQYLGGEAITFSAARAHKSFSDANIVASKPLENRTYFIGADFNVSPLAWVYGYRDGDVIYFVDEIVIEDNANIDQAMTKAAEKGWGNYKVELFADPAARQRSLVGDTELNCILKAAKKMKWPIIDRTAKSHPPVKSRIATLDAAIMNMKEERKLFVTDNCKRLIDEFKNTGRTNNGYDPGKLKDRGHILDAAGYAYHGLFHRKETKAKSIWA